MKTNSHTVAQVIQLAEAYADLIAFVCGFELVGTDAANKEAERMGLGDAKRRLFVAAYNDARVEVVRDENGMPVTK